jgi:hypothetical protein
MTGSSERFGWGLILPAILVTFAILVLTLAFSFYVSFHRWDLTMVPSRLSWVGLRNYVSLLTDAEFWRVLRFTLLYTFARVAGVERSTGQGSAIRKRPSPHEERHSRQHPACDREDGRYPWTSGVGVVGRIEALLRDGRTGHEPLQHAQA